MKQFILIGVVSGLLMATIPLRAQVAQRDSDARKGSRLELGRTASTRKTTTPALPSQRFEMTPNPGLSGLDRAISLNKNTAINAHYRSLLMTKSASKATTKTATTESVSTATSDLRPAVIQETKTKEESLYSSDKLWVSNAYPNPADEVAELDYQFNGSVREAKLTLLNVLGTPITSHELDRNERKVRIATRNLDTGYYLYQLTLDGDKVATKRLLVRHQ
ncbi:T9SS type A sorting domain-containing protein [Spirosoma validum]|uniref:T9SS type A sorting domain-containing protein n=1 Tax=Spirosoma validum TaxID=2771355 RepID=A0A927B4B9_9BACT|nr:T9SS type A sorting domain-containing protein [Spirosoma validum]MBD2755405.1 T9SS type A sorting domain-containing protein [Spirosoma validum]